MSDLLGVIIFRPEMDGGRWMGEGGCLDEAGLTAGRQRLGALCLYSVAPGEDPGWEVEALPRDVLLPPRPWRVSVEDEGLCSAGCPLWRALKELVVSQLKDLCGFLRLAKELSSN